VFSASATSLLHRKSKAIISFSSPISEEYLGQSVIVGTDSMPCHPKLLALISYSARNPCFALRYNLFYMYTLKIESVLMLYDNMQKDGQLTANIFLLPDWLDALKGNQNNHTELIL
jgi:hypothetical protein